MKRTLASVAVIAALASPASALQTQPGSRDAQVLQVLVVTMMAQFMCPNVEPNPVVAERLEKKLGMSDADMANPRLKADFNELAAIHRQNVQASCAAIETDYGPNGKLIPDLVKPRTTKKPLAGRFPAGSPEAKVALYLGTAVFVRQSCPAYEVDTKIGAAAKNALGISDETFHGDALKPDIQLTITLYEDKPRAEACALAWQHFGDRGDVLPDFLTRKR